MELLVANAAGLGGFSPATRRRPAFATVLIGGPLSLIQALAAWNSRLAASSGTIRSAAKLLDASRKNLPIEKARDVDAAVLLRRLALIKFIPLGLSHQIVLTEKAEKLLRAADKSTSKKSKVRDS